MVQTFILHSDLDINAQLLDQARLLKQRLEARQILAALEARAKGYKVGWVDHVVTRSWEGYSDFLKCYYNAIIIEVHRRNLNNTLPLYPYSDELYAQNPWSAIPSIVIEPDWWNFPEIKYTHQANLLLKMPRYYYPILKKIPSILTESRKYQNQTAEKAFLSVGYIWPARFPVNDRFRYLSQIHSGAIKLTEVADPVSDKLSGPYGPHYCPAKISSGPRKGQACLQILDPAKKQTVFCGRHRKYDPTGVEPFNFSEVISDLSY